MRRIKFPVGVKLFIAIWLAALCVPTVRELPNALALYNLRGIEGPGELVEKLDLPRSDNLTGEIWRAEIQYRRGDKGAIDVLAARYPADLQIKANQLVLSAEQWKNLKKTRQQPDAILDILWIRNAQVARDAANIEPDNVFWPWMEAAFEFASRHDDAALQSFERAAKCTRYQDYSATMNRERIEWLESQRHLAWEQKMMLSFSIPFSYLGPMRQSTYLASQRAGELRKGKQIPRALSIEVGVLNANRLARRDAKYETTATTAEYGAIYSLEKFLNVTPISPEKFAVLATRTEHSEELVRDWEKFTRQLNRPQLASAASFVGEAPTAAIFHMNAESDINLELYGLRSTQGYLALIAPYIMLLLALTIVLGTVVWLSGLLLRFKVEKTTRGQITLCANFSFWLFAATAVGLCALYGYYLYPLSSDFLSVIFVAPIIIAVAVACWIIPIFFISWLHGRAHDFDAQMANGSDRNKLWLSRLLCLISIACFILLVFTLYWSGTFFDTTVILIAAATTTLVALKLNWATAREQCEFGWQLAHKSVGILILMWSVVFLLMAIGVWPLRAQLNQSLNRKLEIGEIAWMREQIAKTK